MMIATPGVLDEAPLLDLTDDVEHIRRRLRRLDDAAFDAGEMEAIDLDTRSVVQGSVEGSNVNPISEMTDMIAHFRLFESQQKLLQTTDQILGHVTRELGKF